MTLRPMLATLAEAPLKQKGLVYEPKYDGIRALIEIVPSAKGASVHIWSRNGNEKTAQFPAIARALETAGRKLKAPMVLDGEIAAVDEEGRPAGFQRLQGRMHLRGAQAVERAEQAQPAAFIAFDLLREGRTDLTGRSLTERRKRLEKVFAATLRVKTNDPILRLSEQVANDATAMHARARKEGWEGLIAKEAASTYQPGRRSPAWRKIKLLQEQGIRRRWMDRAAADASILRRAPARRVRGGSTDLLRTHGHRLRSEGTRPRVEAAQVARNPTRAVFREGHDQRTGTLGASGPRRADPVHRVDGGQQAAAPGLPGAAG